MGQRLYNRAYENGPKGRRSPVDYRGSADAQLMSASASPGRTWSSRIVERRLPVLARASAAAVFRSGRCDARISGMGGRQTSALDADMGDESDSWRQPGTERIAHCGVDCHKDPISVK